MRISCNGCRVLRKGCGEECTIRACLEWINSPEGEANATLFLAKFYGRAGLLHLLHSAPQPLRPAIFRSLLYEACGRIVNPIHGSVGLMWSGNWARCQAAVDSVLRGLPITSDAPGTNHIVSPLKSCDIRHVPKDAAGTSSDAHDLADGLAHKRFKQETTSRRKRRIGEPSHDAVPAEVAENREASNMERPPELGLVLGLGGQLQTSEAGLELTLGWDPVAGPPGAASNELRRS